MLPKAFGTNTSTLTIQGPQAIEKKTIFPQAEACFSTNARNDLL